MTFADQMAAHQDAVAAKQAVIDSLGVAATSLRQAGQDALKAGDSATASALFDASIAANKAATDLIQTPNPPEPTPPSPPTTPPNVDEEGEAMAQAPPPSGAQPAGGQSPPPSDPPPSDPPPSDPPSGDPSATPAGDGGGDDRNTGSRLPPGPAEPGGRFGALLGQPGGHPTGPGQPGDPSPDSEGSPHSGPGQPGMVTPPGSGAVDPPPEAEAGGGRLAAGRLTMAPVGAGFTDPSPVATVEEATRRFDAQLAEAKAKLARFQAMLNKAARRGRTDEPG
jgi:hypothetical protein